MQKVDKSRARRIAIAECERRGWRWGEPVNVKWKLFSYVVWTDAGRRGGNCVVVVRKKDGAVMSAGQITR
jgi:hypothetical protein